MSRQFAIDRINQARTSVRHAIEHWNGADLPQVAAVQKLLEAAVLEFEQVPDRLRGVHAMGADDLYSLVSDLKRDIAHLMRVIDACSAFHRGLAVRLGDCVPTYDAAGRIAAGADLETGGLEA